MGGALPDFEEAGDGPPLVLIHGHPFNRTMWRPQLQSLSAELRVIAPDLPGYGASPGRGSRVTMPEFAAAMIELADHLRLERFAVAGLSMGGLVTMELGLRHPDRVAGVALVATTAAPVTAAEADDRRAAADRIERDGILDLALDMAGKLFGPVARRDPAIVEPVVSMMLRTSPAGAAAALRGRAERPDYATLLRGLTVPALVVAGDHDAYADEAVVAQLVGALPAPEVVRLPGTGHLPNLEAPAAFDAALGAFVARVLPA
jgi:pimeloyl-ACP methyl ester carboxylesterase